ncbi:MAG: LPS assembly lipoprotein LptE [Cytophagales bacterium]
MKKLPIITAIILSFVLTGCYSFNPAKSSTSLAKMKTFSIGVITDQAGGPSFLSNKVTDKLRNYFLQNTRLKMVTENADLNITGKIVFYNTSTNAVSTTNTSENNRLTLRIVLDCENVIEPSESFQNSSFENFEVYNANQNLVSVEQDLTTKILDNITIEVFNKVFSW